MESDNNSPKRAWLTERSRRGHTGTRSKIPSAQEVLDTISNGELVSPYNLFYGLGFDTSISKERFGPTVRGQYLRALQFKQTGWTEEARHYARLIFDADWIEKNLPLETHTFSPVPEPPEHTLHQPYYKVQTSSRGITPKSSSNRSTASSSGTTYESSHKIRPSSQENTYRSSHKVPASSHKITYRSSHEIPASSRGITYRTSHEIPASSRGITYRSSHESTASSRGITYTSSHEIPASSHGNTYKSSHEVPASSRGITYRSSHEIPASSRGITYKSSHETPTASHGITYTSSHEIPASSRSITCRSSHEVPASSQGITYRSSHETPASSRGITQMSSHEIPASSRGITYRSSHETPASSRGITYRASHEIPTSSRGITYRSSHETPASSRGITYRASHEIPTSSRGITYRSSYETPASSRGITYRASHEIPTSSRGITYRSSHETPASSQGITYRTSYQTSESSQQFTDSSSFEIPISSTGILYESTHMNPDSFSDINQSSHDIPALSVYESSNIATESVQSFPATICGKDTNIHLQFDPSFPADTSGKERETSYFTSKTTSSKRKREMEPTKKAKKGRPSMCPLPNCNRSTRKLKEHATLHFPTVLRENTNLEFEESELQNLRHRSLETLVQYVLGPNGTLPDLVKYLNEQETLPDTNLTVISPHCLQRMISLSHHKKWKIPEIFSLNPVNSPACLLHWRILLILLRKLTDQERESFQQFGSTPQQSSFENPLSQPSHVPVLTMTGLASQTSPVPVLTRTGLGSLVSQDIQMVEPTQTTYPEAIDSHFHLDRTRRKLWGQQSMASVEELVQYTPPPLPTRQVQVTGGVAVYCDPDSYPPAPTIDSPWKTAVGFHPRHATLFSESTFQQLDALLHSPFVTALGEIGLDRTEPEFTWELQETVLKKLLQLCNVRKPLILHIRGPFGDHLGTDTRSKCLEIVKDCCAPIQPIHLHCFSGGPEDVYSWTTAFHSCYFGFTSAVARFNMIQLQGLRAVPPDRILLETDSPYFPQAGVRINTPAYIGDVAQEVGRFLPADPEQLLKLTVKNSRALYNI